AESGSNSGSTGHASTVTAQVDPRPRPLSRYSPRRAVGDPSGSRQLPDTVPTPCRRRLPDSPAMHVMYACVGPGRTRSIGRSLGGWQRGVAQLTAAVGTTRGRTWVRARRGAVLVLVLGL